MRYFPMYFVWTALWLSTAAFAQNSRSLPSFGAPEDGESLPGFGPFSEELPTVIAEDRAYATNLFQHLDADKNGALSREELRKFPFFMNVEESFFRFDADRNNSLSPRELTNFRAKAREDQSRKARREARAKQQASEFQATQSDIDKAKAQLRQLDRNRDRRLDKKEAAAAWGDQTDQIFAEHDLNRTGFLISKELARHLAKQRANENGQQKQQQEQQPRRVQFGQFTLRSNGGQFFLVQRQPRATPAQVMIGRHDANGNGALERVEWQGIEGRFDGADADRNGSLTQEELSKWLEIQSSDQPSSPSSSAPAWFAERDANLDGQVSMPEYASQWSGSLLEEFARYDHNQDGLISVAESRARLEPTVKGREFASGREAVIEPGIGASSSIQVDEDFEIADIDLRLSISHPAPVQLDALLVAPGGKRVELFTGEGKEWKGANFEDTLFDDEATTSVANASPPFRGSLATEAAGSKAKAGLASLYGERSQGVWRLFIRATRGDRAGLLNGWSLVLAAKPRTTQASN